MVLVATTNPRPNQNEVAGLAFQIHHVTESKTFMQVWTNCRHTKHSHTSNNPKTVSANTAAHTIEPSFAMSSSNSSISTKSTTTTSSCSSTAAPQNQRKTPHNTKQHSHPKKGSFSAFPPHHQGIFVHKSQCVWAHPKHSHSHPPKGTSQRVCVCHFSLVRGCRPSHPGLGGHSIGWCGLAGHSVGQLTIVGHHSTGGGSGTSGSGTSNRTMACHGWRLYTKEVSSRCHVTNDILFYNMRTDI